MPTVPVTGPKVPDIKQMQDLAKPAAKVGAGDKGSFDSVLKGVADNHSTAQVQNMAAQTPAQVAKLPQNPPKIDKKAPSVRVQNAKNKSPVEHFLSSVVSSQSQMNDLVKFSMTGQNLSPQQMLVLQEGISKASTTLNLAGSMVGQVVSGLKTLLQVQV